MTELPAREKEIRDALRKIRDALPPLAKDDRQRLAVSMLKHGQQVPIIADAETGEIIDGMHRREVCLELGREPRIERRHLTDKERLELPVSLNLARRHLGARQKKAIATALRKTGLFTQEEVASLVGVSRRRVGQMEEEAPEGGGGSNGRISIASPPPIIPDQRIKLPPPAREEIVARAEEGETQAQIAADYGVTRRRVGQIVAAARKKEARQEAERATIETIEVDDRVLVGDFRDHAKNIPDASLSLIFTDPPYNRKAKPLLASLAVFARDKLLPGGSLLCYVGQTQLPDALDAFREHLRYWWVIAVLHQPGHATMMYQYGLHACWKAILWFVKERRANDQVIVNDIMSGGREKDQHPWQQAQAEAAYWIQMLCPEHGIVCDPFLGSGTTALAAERLGRKWIGMEIDENTARKASARLLEHRGNTQ